jgi:hypothetical protein
MRHDGFAFSAECPSAISIPASRMASDPQHATVLRKGFLARNFGPKTLVNVRNFAILSQLIRGVNFSLPP